MASSALSGYDIDAYAEEIFQVLLFAAQTFIERNVLLSYMSEVDTTRVSSRGQVVIPQAVREAIGMREGEIFAVFGEGDTIVLKRVEAPDVAELKAILAKGERFAKKHRLTRRDVTRAIRETRAE